jgi:hypothetical protein
MRRFPNRARSFTSAECDVNGFISSLTVRVRELGIAERDGTIQLLTRNDRGDLVT